jgi:L-lactate dehydrogenase complex protein LldG
MNNAGHSSRDRILQRLRASKPPFEDAPPRPAQYLPVTRLDEDADLVARFKAEVERLTGHVHLPPTALDAMNTILDIVGEDRTVMGWENLPLPGLNDDLAARGIQIVIPRARGDQRLAELQKAEPIRVGITGADAAFATTGTLALITNEQQGRLPSLLPPVHVALLRRDRLFPRLEDWLASEGRAVMSRSASIVLVTGPSRTGDIEMQTILGVHGPGVIHVIVLP